MNRDGSRKDNKQERVPTSLFVLGLSIWPSQYWSVIDTHQYIYIHSTVSWGSNKQITGFKKRVKIQLTLWCNLKTSTTTTTNSSSFLIIYFSIIINLSGQYQQQQEWRRGKRRRITLIFIHLLPSKVKSGLCQDTRSNQSLFLFSSLVFFFYIYVPFVFHHKLFLLPDRSVPGCRHSLLLWTELFQWHRDTNTNEPRGGRDNDRAKIERAAERQFDRKTTWKQENTNQQEREKKWCDWGVAISWPSLFKGAFCASYKHQRINSV